MAALLEGQPVFGYTFAGRRFYWGDKAGFQPAHSSCALDHPELRDEILTALQGLIA